MVFLVYYSLVDLASSYVIKTLIFGDNTSTRPAFDLPLQLTSFAELFLCRSYIA